MITVAAGRIRWNGLARPPQIDRFWERGESEDSHRVVLRFFLGRPPDNARKRRPMSFSALLRKPSLPSGRPRFVKLRNVPIASRSSRRDSSSCHCPHVHSLPHHCRSSKRVGSVPENGTGTSPLRSAVRQAHAGLSLPKAAGASPGFPQCAGHW